MASSAPIATEGKKKARIEIIPLIDVIFFLLATFVLVIINMDKLASVPVQLPVANPTPQKPDDTMVTLQMSDGDVCYWNREQITVADIAPRLEDYKKRITIPRVLIAGDGRAKFGSTVLALDAVRKAGIAQVSIETQVRPTGR